MLIYSGLFYLFSFVVLMSALVVITASNPIHSVLCLILAFFSSAGLFVMLNAEFIAMMIVVVYVGAVVVLFLFVVMMLNVDYSTIRAQFVQNKVIALMVAFILAAEIFASVYFTGNNYGDNINELTHVQNTNLLGKVLYTDYFYCFQLCGIILLIAMIGAITLTLRQKPNVKRQNICEQVSANKENRVKLIDVDFGQGIKDNYYNGKNA